MKAVVLAGGYATRLWPITKTRAKPLLPLAGRPIVDRILAPLEEEPAVDEVFVSTNQRFEEDFEDYLDEAGYEKPTLAIEPTTHEDEKLGTIGALADLVDRRDLDDDTLVIAGDNVFSFDVADFLDFYGERDGACIASYDVGSREAAKQYGLVALDGDRVVDFQEKPDDPKSTLVSIACYAFPAGTLELLDDYLAGDNNPDAPGFFLEWLYDRQDVFGYVFDGAWYDIGTPESYLEANAHELDGETLVADDVTVEDSRLGPNTYAMAGASFHDADVENSIVFPDARIDDCTVRDSIVDRETDLVNIDVSNALVGAHTELNGELDR